MLKSFAPRYAESIPNANVSSVGAGNNGAGNNYASLSRVAAVSIQKDFYVKNFGFFCRKELQLEKSVRFPVRLRLGSLEQCNTLEGKY